MSKIKVKIVEIDQRTRSVVVKFASESSKKSIDEYDGLAFQVSNFTAVTPKDFIDGITTQISKLVAIRDSSENVVANLDLTEWANYATEIDAVEISEVAPAASAQIVQALANPEVVL
jgi:hypothetical protein